MWDSMVHLANAGIGDQYVVAARDCSLACAERTIDLTIRTPDIDALCLLALLHSLHCIKIVNALRVITAADDVDWLK